MLCRIVTPNGNPIREVLDRREFMRQQSLTRPLQYDYDMRHQKRGVALIFNHDTFNDTNLGRRPGTAVDSQNLQTTFKKLGFDVWTYNDRTFLQIKQILRDCKKNTLLESLEYWLLNEFDNFRCRNGSQ